MRKFLLRMHRRVVPRLMAFWYSRWGERSFLVLLAMLIGGLAALAAAVLHWAVERLELAAAWVNSEPELLHRYFWMALLVVLPLAGIFLSFLVQRWLGGPRYAKSLSPLILSLSRRRTGIPASESLTHMLSSALSVGFGGSAGLEAPSVLTGAALGSTACSIFRINRKRRSLLLGCGAAAAISAIFNSPIGGVLFAAEVLLPEFSVSALVPMLMSSAVAAVVSRLIIDHYSFAITMPWRHDAVFFYLLLGIVAAFIGVYVIRAAYGTAGWLKKRFPNRWHRLFTGGAMLCLLLFIFPTLRGQGYLFIELLFQGDLEQLAASAPLLGWIPGGTVSTVVLLVTAALLLKVVASALTVDSGGDGGIFAPAMFIGAFTGFAFARLVNMTGLIELQEANFIVVGMCGVFTAVMHAPLTGIFLIADVTGGYILLVPLMIVSSTAFFVCRFLEPHSIYRKALAESNQLSDDRDKEMLKQLRVGLLVDKKYSALRETDPFTRITDLVAGTSYSTFPVLDDDGRLTGVVSLTRIRSVMLNSDVYNCLLVFDVMEEPLGVLSVDDDLAQAMALFDISRRETLPVCDEAGRFKGFLEKQTVFAKYRSRIKDESDEF